MKNIALFILLILSLNAVAQKTSNVRDFLQFQKSFKTVANALQNNEDSLKAQFTAKGLQWPAQYLYVRSFKYDGILEVWAKNTNAEPYKLFKSYKVCAFAGNLGPKRFEGDYQVPEGFYYFNEFKANSQYHMALGVNYPNASDRVLSDQRRPGSRIMVHGSCVTVGCIPLMDEPIEELYVITMAAKANGLDYIPLHIYPAKFKLTKSRAKVDEYVKTNPDYNPLLKSFMQVYFYFENKKQLPNIIVDENGYYEILEAFTYSIPVKKPKFVYKENTATRNIATKIKQFSDSDFYNSVFKMPVYPGGNEAFQVFLDSLSKELTPLLPSEKKRVFVQIDFVIDKSGQVYNVKVADNANNEINNIIIERFESMKKWTPAVRDKPVDIKLQQTIMIDAKPEVKKVKKSDEDDEEDDD